MTRRRVNNPLALAVLGCLAERPMHPYEISTTLRTRGKEKSIKLNYGSLYSVVDSLQKHGLIQPKETIRAGRLPIELRSERTTIDIVREQGVPDMFLVEGLLRIAMLEAELRFVEQLVHDIRSGELPGVTTWARLHDLLAEGRSAEEIFADPVRFLGEEGRALADLPTVTAT